MPTQTALRGHHSLQAWTYPGESGCWVLAVGPTECLSDRLPLILLCEKNPLFVLLAPWGCALQGGRAPPSPRSLTDLSQYRL